MTTNTPPQPEPLTEPPTGALTGMERALLDCVRRLNDESERSVSVLTALERRSTGRINDRLDGLTDSFTSLAMSQRALVNALTSLVSGSATLSDAQTALRESETALKAAERSFSGAS